MNMNTSAQSALYMHIGYASSTRRAASYRMTLKFQRQLVK